MYYQDPMYHIIPSGDYLHVVCAKCKEQCEMDFKGRDPAMVLIEITCPSCGTSGEWKLHRAGNGFPFEGEYEELKKRRAQIQPTY